MKKETSSVKFRKCTIGCNFVSVKWNGKAYSFRKGGSCNKFGLCDKMGQRDMAIKVSRCLHGKKKKSPWLYSLEEFQGILPRIFLAVP